MSLRFEKVMFRVGVVGLVLLLIAFVRETVEDPTLPAASTETTTEPVEATTTTTAPTTTTTAAPARFAAVSPSDETRVALPSVLIAGVGNPGAVVARNEFATNVDARGVWALRVPLAEGVNEIGLLERAADGSEQTVSLTVYYEPPVE